VLFLFGYRLGPGFPRGAQPLHRGPAVHSNLGDTALHIAVRRGNRRIVRLLVAFNADVNARGCNGCAVSAAANRP
jgi:hypothetical protein